MMIRSILSLQAPTLAFDCLEVPAIRVNLLHNWTLVAFTRT
jgi:hypothetical protein